MSESFLIEDAGVKSSFLFSSVISLLIASMCSMPSQANAKKITEAEAVKIAEIFVADNGYTEAKPNTKKLAPESLNWGRTYEAELKLRHNTLEPKAYGIAAGNREGKGWTVVFKQSREFSRTWGSESIHSESKRATGRAVCMNEYGEHCMVMHKDIFLDIPMNHLQNEQSPKPESK